VPDDDAFAGLLSGFLRAAERRDGAPPALDVRAIEYVGPECWAMVRDAGTGVAGVELPPPGEALLWLEIELPLSCTDERVLAGLEGMAERTPPRGPVFRALADALGDYKSHDLLYDAALPGDRARRERHRALRESVPQAMVETMGRLKQTFPGAGKCSGDPAVPVDRLPEALAAYRNAFESRGLRYAIWGHASDGNLHPNAIPASEAEFARAKEAIGEINRLAIAMGGVPLAEHGVGRNPLKQEAMRLYRGDGAIEQMRAIKRALDPSWTLAPGVLFARQP
jgi:D-lactate dehydrogenase (cytochrome)